MRTKYFNFWNTASTISIASFFLLVGAVVVLSGCSNSKNVTILGAGATFPYPIYSEMFVKYEQEVGTKVNYQSIGSGGGVKQITAQTVDFGATDAHLSDKVMDEFAARNENIIHFPIVLGAVAVIYNVPKLSNVSIKLDGVLISKIFAGEITKWSAEELKTLNPDVNFPDADIIVVRRSDGSGTTKVFTDFLAYSDASWFENYGVGKSIDWFQGSIGAKGNEGVASSVQNTPYSIGYANLNYASTLGITYASVKNLTGNYILPSPSSVSSAGAISNIPDDLRVSISSVGVLGSSYPISTFTWLILYQEQSYGDRTKEQAIALRDLVRWMVTSGQSLVEPLNYTSIPQPIVEANLKLLDELTYNGSPF